MWNAVAQQAFSNELTNKKPLPRKTKGCVFLLRERSFFIEGAIMIKGLAITPPVLGRISIGKVIEKNGKRLPEKDDQFTITSQVQGRDGWVTHPLDENYASFPRMGNCVRFRFACYSTIPISTCVRNTVCLTGRQVVRSASAMATPANATRQQGCKHCLVRHPRVANWRRTGLQTLWASERANRG
jgi:hypothetical protein